MRLFLLLILPLLAVTDPSGQGLVFPQSACNIKCENGGMCAFSFSNPAVHSCICLIGVYSGDRCQYKIGEDPLENVEKENEALRVPDQNRIEAERREAEARVNDQRRREYEQKIREEEERKRSQDSERQRYEEEYRRREGERQRVEEQRRQEMARREQEQRAREQHRVTEDQRRVDSQWGQEDQRRREHQMREEQRQREEEKRQEDLRKLQERRKQEEERQRQEEDKKRQEEQAREQVNTRLKVENYDSEELTDEDLEPEQPEGNTWDYKQEPTAQEESSQIEKPPAGSIGQIATVLESAATKAAEEHGIDLGEEIVTEPHLEPEEEGDEVKVEEGQEEHDDETFGAVKNVLREAAEKTAEEHSIDLTAEEEKKKDHNDYWDHHPKKDELEYETPKMVDSEEEDEIRRDQDSLNMKKTEAPETEATTDVKEYPLEEGEDGWMIVKHADSQKDEEAGASTAFTVAIVALILSLAA